MLTTTKDRHEFLRAEGEFEEKTGTSDYRDSISGQKQIGPPLYEAVSSWSDEVAQTQEMRSLIPRHRQIQSNRLSRAHGENIHNHLIFGDSPSIAK